MINFLGRALRHPSDYRHVLRWQRVPLLRQEEHAGGVHSFVFEKPAHLTWKAGQHGVWWFLDERLPGGNWRAFSVASSHHEAELRVGTIIPETSSAFKQKLCTLQPGDPIWLQGPFGELHAKGKAQIVGIAGGIGITPFRALAYEIAHGYLPDTHVTLIYSATEHYTYRQELEAWAQKTDDLTIIYTHTPEEVNAALDELVRRYGNDAYYCLSGSPGMITALKRSCREKGVQKIINDPFKGY